MKRVIVLVFFLLSFYIFPAMASDYEVQVVSFSEEEILLTITNLKTVDVRVYDVTATMESEGLFDTYTADAKLVKKGEEVFLKIDIHPIFEDYSSAEVESITVSGIIERNGEREEFGKRVPFRTKETLRQAPEQESTMLIYWVIGLCLIFVSLILFLFYRRPKKKKQKSVQKTKKRKKRKKQIKVQKKKKLKKRL